MRGPRDDVIDEQQQPGGEEAAPALTRSAAGGARRRPPGGKALLRLMQVLERTGYAAAAEEVVAHAIPDPERDAFQARLAAVSAAPGGPEAAASARSRARRTAAPPATEELASAYAEVAERLGPPTPTGPQWRSLGPFTIPNGQTYGASRVNVSGRVAAIAVHPTQPARVLCGAANGGVWESFDRGATWAPRTDFQKTLTVGALVYDPHDPSRVYCGTGEGNWWSFLGTGVLRSTDGGTTWAPLAAGPFVGQGFFDLRVDPGSADRLVAATTGGLYVSTNAGAAWTERRSAVTWSVALARSGAQSRLELLAACDDGLKRSTNGGTSWSNVALPGAPASFTRLAVAIAPSNAAVAYAWGASDSTAFLWRRSTAGTWSKLPLPPGLDTAQAWYDWFLAVAPDRANQIYVGAIDAYRGELDGTTWKWFNLSSKPAGGSSIHPDQHAVAFEPGSPATVYIGCDGGLYRSADRGVTFKHCNNGLVISEFEYLAHHPGSTAFILGGTQDNGTARYRGSTTWDHAADGDGGDCAVNVTTPATVFHTYFGMSPERSTTSGAFGSWTDVTPPVPAGEGSLFYPPLEASAKGGGTIAIGGDALYLSRNNGTSWTRKAIPGGGGRCSALAVPDAATVFVGLLDGRVLRTRFSAGAWSALAALGTPRAGVTVSDLQVDPNDARRIWATCSAFGGGRVFRSDDGGAHWTNRSGNLPDLPANAIALDPVNASRAWVGADLGVYQTKDGGATWSDFSSSLPNAFVGDVLFHAQSRRLRAGTRNRGVWEIDVDGAQGAAQTGVQFTATVDAGATQRLYSEQWPASWQVLWTVMPTTPGPGGPQVTWTTHVERSSAEHNTYWVEVTNASGEPVTVEGRFCVVSRG